MVSGQWLERRPRCIWPLTTAVICAAFFACVARERVVLKYRWKLERAPSDAREVLPGTYIRTNVGKELGPSIETLPEFGYAETINPNDRPQAVTSLEVASFHSIPASLTAIFAGARIGETRLVWSCPSRSRTNCELTEYSFYRPPR